MAEKHLCNSCGHIGYLVSLHNDEHCEKCYSRDTVVWRYEVKEPRRVLVKSDLGLPSSKVIHKTIHI